MSFYNKELNKERLVIVSLCCSDKKLITVLRMSSGVSQPDELAVRCLWVAVVEDKEPAEEMM